MAPPSKVKTYDPAFVAAMTDPFSIRLERIDGAGREPIPLPPKPNPDGGFYPPGMGWTKDEMQSFERWLVQQWTGGGRYEASITDQLNVTHAWHFFYNPTQYPKRQVPMMDENGVPMNAPTMAAQPAMQPIPAPVAPVFYGGGNGGDEQWPPLSSTFAQPMPLPMAPMPGQFQNPAALPFGRPPGSIAVSQAEYDKRILQQQLATAQDMIRRAETEQIEARHRADMERMRAERAKEIDDLKRSLAPKEDPAIVELKQLVAAIAAKPAPVTGPSPEMSALMEQNKQLQQQLAEDRRAAAAKAERDAERAEARADAQRRDDAMQQQLAAVRAEIAARAPAGPDPMMVMMQEMSRQQAESARQQAEMFREVIRDAKAQTDSLKGLVLSPRDIIAMTKESAAGIDDMRRTMTGTFTDIFQMQRQVVENAISMQPQGEGISRFIPDAIEGIKGAVGAVVGAQRDSNVNAAKAATENAKAQAEFARVQHAQLEIMAQREAQQRAMEAAAASGVAVGLNGVNYAGGAAQAGIPAQATPEPGTGAPGAAPAIEVVDATQNGTAKPALRNGKTDEQWFSVVLPHVLELREGVKEYLEGIYATPPRLDPKTKEPVGVDPESAAEGIIAATNQIIENKAKLPAIPAFQDLFLGQRYSEFMDVLLPDAPARYRADVMGHIITTINAAATGGDAGDGEDGDEHGADPS